MGRTGPVAQVARFWLLPRAVISLEVEQQEVEADVSRGVNVGEKLGDRLRLVWRCGEELFEQMAARRRVRGRLANGVSNVGAAVLVNFGRRPWPLQNADTQVRGDA
jgi:hypothetical protein